MGTSGYNAGIDSSDLVMSYALESAWGVTPTVAFQGIRLMGEGFSESKTRIRPQEIRATGDSAHAITQQVAAEGSLDYALSYGTYDDLLRGAINSVAWSTPLAIDSVANDIVADATLTGGGVGFSSATSGKFDNIQVGQWIRVFGFVASSGVNNGLYRVVRRTTGASPVVEVSATAGNGAALVDETPASGTQSIRGSMIRNGVDVNTFVFQKQLASALFLLYNGAYVSSASLEANVGSFMQGSFDFLVKNESKATSNQSTGAVLAPPTGRVMDTVAGFSALQSNDAAISGVLQSVSLEISKENARSQYGIGSASAQGMGRGTLMVGGKLSVYFGSFALYDLYKAETDVLLTFRVADNTGAGYVFTLPAVTLMNPQIVAGGPDTDIVAEFELEGNPAPSSDTVYNGVTIQVDKMQATAAG